MDRSAVVDIVSPFIFASLLELSSLQGLRITDCQGVAFDRDPNSAGIYRGLAELNMEVYGQGDYLDDKPIRFPDLARKIGVLATSRWFCPSIGSERFVLFQAPDCQAMALRQ